VTGHRFVVAEKKKDFMTQFISVITFSSFWVASDFALENFSMILSKII